jgi:hypothetical protein
VELDKIVKSMLDDFKLSSGAEADNRERALFVLDFVRPGADQFSSDALLSRGKRPSHSFNQLPKFGRQVINDQWQNLPQIKFIPETDTDVELAEVLEDKIREVQSQGCAQTAYKMAIASQINIGWGYFAFATDYDNDDSNDQNIYIRQIPNTFQVYDDPACREQDRSDRRFLIEVEDIPRTEFNDRYERDYSDGDLQSTGSDYPGWAAMGKDLVRVGHYWRMEYDKETIWFDKETGKKVTEKPKDTNNYNMRVIKKPRVMYYKCTAKERLEERKWPGKHIPFCFVEGNKTIVNGKTYLTGLYEDMISSQVLYNYATNTAIELAESAPIAPWTGDIRAFKGFEKYYDTVNQKNYSYLPHNAIDESGNPINAPQRMQNGADLSAAVALIQMAEQNFYGTSGIYPASLGQKSNEQSGKAIMARQREGDVSTSNYADTFKRALIYGGIIFEDLRKKIYDGSREFQVMSEDNKTRGVKINQKYQDHKTGKMIEYDMTKGKMGVAVTTGVSYTTKREESREAQIQLFQAAPQAMLPALPMIVRSMDWPNADKTADAIERGLPPELRDPEREAEQMQGIPPAAQAQLQQAQQIIQQLGQALQEAQQVANDKQAEAQLKMGELEVKAQTARTTAEKNQVDAEIKAAELQFEREKLGAELSLEAQRLELEKVKILAGVQSQEMNRASGSQEKDVSMLKDMEPRESDDISVELQVQGLEEQRKNNAMLLEMLNSMKNGMENLSAGIMAPKKIEITRNPKTMFIEQAISKTV